ncbi:hypothetical protein FACS189437_01230 [Bacteroidia bacterium]|nr:hypothetical protein FACS189437_01230 [Bacteroidia bacterium]
MNKNIVRHAFVFIIFTLLVLGCGKEEQEAGQTTGKAAVKTGAAKGAPTSQQCMEKSVFGTNSFKNDCIGLEFSSNMPFLYGKYKIYGQAASFAVPTGDFAVKIFIFQDTSKGMTDEASRLSFQESMKNNVLKTPEMQVRIVNENITEINKIPVLFIETRTGDEVERNYYFFNRGRWVQLVFSTTNESYYRNRYMMDELIKNVVLY